MREQPLKAKRLLARGAQEALIGGVASGLCGDAGQQRTLLGGFCSVAHSSVVGIIIGHPPRGEGDGACRITERGLGLGFGHEREGGEIQLLVRKDGA
jgi:hypothetical protein